MWAPQKRHASAPWAGAILVLATMWGSRAAEAHQQSATFGEIIRAGDSRDVTWRLRVRVGDLALMLGSSADLALSDSRWPRARLENYLRAGMHVEADGEPCAPGDISIVAAPDEAEPMLVLSQAFRCGPNEGPLRLRYDLFFDRDRFHQSFTKVTLAETASTVIFRDGLREITIDEGARPSIWRSAATYLRLGVFHILTGYDHLSFLMALLLGAALSRRTTGHSEAAAASVKQALVGTVTVISAFTVAHSITLILQVLRPGWISTRFVEPAIAFSVAYVGFENLIPRPPRRRWLLVFGFGLVHGLGFASVLREIGLPRRGLVLSLLSFNLGVEIGQLLVLAATFPLIVGAARRAPRRFERWGLRLGSGVIAAFGTAWLVVRLASL